MKKVIATLLLLSVSFTSFAQPQEIGDKMVISAVHKLLKSRSINPKETCLDEYMGSRKKYILMTAMGPVGAPLPAAGATYGGALAGAGFAALSGTYGWEGLFLAIASISVGAYAGLFGAIAGLTAFEVYSIVKLVKSSYLVRVIANAHDGKGQQLDSFTKKYLRHYSSDKNVVDSQVLAKIIADADKSGALCDGSIVKRQKRKMKNRNKLATKNDIFRYIHNQLK